MLLGTGVSLLNTSCVKHKNNEEGQLINNYRKKLMITLVNAVFNMVLPEKGQGGIFGNKGEMNTLE